MKKTIVLLVALACSVGNTAAEWRGHLASLFDAQVACTNIDSLECKPFLAEAVAVADLLDGIARPTDDGNDFIVTFRNMHQEKCSQNWFASLNGLSLLHSALGLSEDSPKSIYWTDALIRASRQLCHS
jgi:hypothetical protein